MDQTETEHLYTFRYANVEEWWSEWMTESQSTAIELQWPGLIATRVKGT